MDGIHAEEVEIARKRARALRGFESMMGTATTSTGLNADQVMRHGFRYVEEFFDDRFVEEIKRLEVQKNRLATRRASITHENLRSALRATERAISAQLKLELLSATTNHQQEEAAAAAASAPEIEGLKRVSITKQSSNNNNNNCVGQQGGGGEIILDVCAICHEEWKIGDDVRSVVGCSHAYHYNCISKWIKRKPTCPMCRYEIPTNTNTNTNNNKRRRRTL